MTRSNKPLIWLPFAAGGMLAALLFPAFALVLLLDALGLLPADALAFERMRRLTDTPVLLLALAVILALAFWHAGHRLRMAGQDLGVRRAGPRRLLARLCYLLASAGCLALLLAVIVLL